MSDLKLFRIDCGVASELRGTSVALERSLHQVIERNLEPLFGVRLLASEYSTGVKHGGRMDSLGIDENYSPVIFEYKRAVNENVINQGLFYLDWLMDHRADFKMLVLERLGTAPSSPKANHPAHSAAIPSTRPWPTPTRGATSWIASAHSTA